VGTLVQKRTSLEGLMKGWKAKDMTMEEVGKQVEELMAEEEGAEEAPAGVDPEVADGVGLLLAHAWADAPAGDPEVQAAEEEMEAAEELNIHDPARFAEID